MFILGIEFFVFRRNEPSHNSPSSERAEKAKKISEKRYLRKFENYVGSNHEELHELD